MMNGKPTSEECDRLRAFTAPIRLHDVPALQQLLASRFDPQARSHADETFIALAARSADSDTMRALLNWGIPINAPCDSRGGGPLHVAAFNANTQVLALLIEAGANIMLRDSEHDTPLHRASAGGSSECIRLLLNAGADLESLGVGNATPLNLAAGSRSVDAVETLLKAGANVNTPTQHGATPLMWACMFNPDAAMLLLDFGARIDVVDLDGRNALYWAASFGRTEVAVRLVSGGISLNVDGSEGQEPHRIANKAGHPETAEAVADAVKKRKQLGESQREPDCGDSSA